MIPDLVIADFFKRFVANTPEPMKPRKVAFSSGLVLLTKLREYLSERPFKQGDLWGFIVWSRDALQPAPIMRSHEVRFDVKENPNEPVILRRMRHALYPINAVYVCNSAVIASLFESYLWTDVVFHPTNDLSVEVNIGTKEKPRTIEIPYAVDSENLNISSIGLLDEGGNASLFKVEFSLRITLPVFSPIELCIPKILITEVDTFVNNYGNNVEGFIKDLQIELSHTVEFSS